MQTRASIKKQYQEELDQDQDMKSDYLNAEVSSSESSDDEGSRSLDFNVVLPKSSKSKRRYDTEQQLFVQLMNTQKTLMKYQKKNYKLQSEIDKSEIENRYIKLDLNNAQVKINKYKEDIKDIKAVLKKTKRDKIVMMVIICLFVLYRVWGVIENLV